MIFTDAVVVSAFLAGVFALLQTYLQTRKNKGDGQRLDVDKAEARAATAEAEAKAAVAEAEAKAKAAIDAAEEREDAMRAKMLAAQDLAYLYKKQLREAGIDPAG